MWFKQIQLFQFQNTLPIFADKLIQNLENLAFRPCLPSMPTSIGWVSPLDEEDAPLVHTLDGFMMVCLQFEEKILPSTVIRKELNDKIKKIETVEDRRMRRSEKNLMKDELIMTLLPRAFSRFTRVYGYIDPQNKWLLLGTSNTKKAELFISMLKKSSLDMDVTPLEVKTLPALMTIWLKNRNYPSNFSIESACVLFDPEQTNRVIRCQHQDLFASSIQTLVKEGCEVKQLALSWQDRINFVLTGNLTITSIRFEEEMVAQLKELESETKRQQFDADFFMMSQTLSALFTDLLTCIEDANTGNVIPITQASSH